MKRINLLFLLLFLCFSLPVFCENNIDTQLEKEKKEEIKEIDKLKKSNIYKTIFVTTYGKADKKYYDSKKSLKDAAITDAKKNLLINVCNLFVDKTTFKNNQNILYKEIISNTDRYILSYYNFNTYENNDLFQISIDCEINLNTLYSKITALNIKAYKPVIFIYGVSENNLNIPSSNIIETEFAKKIKDLGFDVIDRISLGIENINDQNFATNLLKYNVKTNIFIKSYTTFSQQENFIRGLISSTADLYITQKAREKNRRVSKDNESLLSSLKELSLDLKAETQLEINCFDIYDFQTYYTFSAKASAKGANTIDLANGLAQNSIVKSIKQSFKDEYKTFTNYIFSKILTRINYNTFYLRIKNINEEYFNLLLKDLSIIDPNINFIKNSLKDNEGLFFFSSELDIFTFSEKLENLKIKDKKIIINSFEDNIISCELDL